MMQKESSRWHGSLNMQKEHSAFSSNTGQRWDFFRCRGSGQSCNQARKRPLEVAEIRLRSCVGFSRAWGHLRQLCSPVRWDMSRTLIFPLSFDQGLWMQACGSHLDIRQSGGEEKKHCSWIKDVKYSFASGLLCAVSNLVSSGFSPVKYTALSLHFSWARNVFKCVFSYRLIPVACTCQLVDNMRIFSKIAVSRKYHGWTWVKMTDNRWSIHYYIIERSDCKPAAGATLCAKHFASSSIPYTRPFEIHSEMLSLDRAKSLIMCSSLLITPKWRSRKHFS